MDDDRQPVLRFSLLGPVRAWRGTDEIDLGSPQQRTVLATLLLHHGRVVHTEDLVDAVWGESPARGAVGALRTYISRLRKLLEPASSGRPQVLVASSGGYALYGDFAVDLAQFEDLIGEAGKCRADNDAARAVDLLRQAVSLWTGAPLAGIQGSYAESQRTRLTERRLVVLEDRLSLDLELGGHHEVLPELLAASKEHPLRERLRGLLMVALFRAGQRADALAAYDTLAETLVENLGIDPGADLSVLRERIESADKTLKWSGFSSYEKNKLPRPAQLPTDIPDFAGRTRLLPDVASILGEGQGIAISALSGLGGVGKTTLAVHLGHLVRDRYPDGQLYIDLRGVDPEPVGPGVALGRFLRALGVPDHSIPGGVDERATLFRATLSGLRVLIVLDNAQDGAQVRPLLPDVPGCAVVITSRTQLGRRDASHGGSHGGSRGGGALSELPSVRAIEVGVLEPQEAVVLLDKVIGDDRVSQDHDAAAELVAACGYLPLAIRVAGARLAGRPSWTVAAMASRLADAKHRLTELRIGDLDVEATFQLSYDQLTETQARAFRLLATPDVADISLPAAAEALALDAGETADLLDSLVELSLLEKVVPERYRYHDLLRLFARICSEQVDPEIARIEVLEQLIDFLLATGVNALHLIWPGDLFVDGLQNTASDGLPLVDDQAARTWLETEWPGIVAIAGQASRMPAFPLASVGDLLAALHPIAEAQGRWPELVATSRTVLDAAQTRGDTAAAARISSDLALGLTELNDLPAAEEAAQHAIRYFRERDDILLLNDALASLAGIHLRRGQHDKAIALWKEVLVIAREVGNRALEADLQANLALVYVQDRRVTEALNSAESSVALYRELGDLAGLIQALHGLGSALGLAARIEEALLTLEEALALTRDVSDVRCEGEILHSTATVLRSAGRASEALPIADQAVEILRSLGNQRQLGSALAVRGDVLVDLNRQDEALACYREAHDLFAGIGLPDADQVRELIESLTGTG